MATLHVDMEPNMACQLRRSMVDFPGKEGRKFLPIKKLEEIVTRETTKRELQSTGVPNGRINAILDDIFAPPTRRKIFAIIVLIERASDIQEFIRSGLDDSNLPFSKTSFDSQHASQLQFFRAWKYVETEFFYEHQWVLLAPFFVFPTATIHAAPHYEFQDRVILPYIQSDETNPATRVEGGFSDVWKVKIHTAHHNLPSNPGQSQCFAIKRLRRSDKGQFDSESKALRRFNHPHIIKLLATYEQNKRYHLVFPWADGDLRDLWASYPSPHTKLQGSIRWLAGQCTGLAHALRTIHQPLSGAGGIRGRHGDLKPDNILWFGKGQGGLGTLVIADFGLTKFHSDASKSCSKAAAVAFSPSYRPPECDIENGMATDRFDIWSLGCLFLEFVTWVFYGYDHVVSTFPSRRYEDDNSKSQEDKFFRVVIEPPGRLTVVVKPAVTQWVESLRSHPSCPGYLRDVLDLVRYSMLVMDPKGRLDADGVYRALFAMEQKHFGRFRNEWVLEEEQPHLEEASSPPPSAGKRPRGFGRFGDIETDTAPGPEAALPPTAPVPVPVKRQKQAKNEDIRNYSCPYRKRNPLRFNIRSHQKCALTTFPDISQVKRHILTYHRNTSTSQAESPVKCDRCLAGFQTKQELNAHLRVPSSRICRLVDASELRDDPEDGVSSVVEKMLRDRRADHQVLGWEAVWRVLFPEDAIIPSAEYNPVLEDHEVLKYFQNTSPQWRALARDRLRTEANGQHTEELWRLFQSMILCGFDRRTHFNQGLEASVLPEKTRLALGPVPPLTPSVTRQASPERSSIPTFLPTSLPPSPVATPYTRSRRQTLEQQNPELVSAQMESLNSEMQSIFDPECEMCTSATTECFLHDAALAKGLWGELLDMGTSTETDMYSM